LEVLLAWAASLDPAWRLLVLLPVLVAFAGIVRNMVVTTAFAALMVFWLVLSGHFTPFLVGAGVCSAIAVLLLGRRMAVVDREAVPIDFLRAVFSYWPWLALEIVRSGWTVTRIILHPRLPISPAMVRFAPSQHTATGLVIHANSITLTPGTLTIQADAGEFLVHGLTASGAEGCVGSEMDRRVAALEAAVPRLREGVA